MPTVYITAPRDAAGGLAQLLVDEHLAACVNLVNCESIYRWDGDVVEDDETILLVKTSDDGYQTLEDRVAEAHPAEVPCIERFDESGLFGPFARWRDGAIH